MSNHHLMGISSSLQGRNIVVFYGSQTGTAEEFANRLSKDAHRYGLRGMAADPEEYDLVTETQARPRDGSYPPSSPQKADRAWPWGCCPVSSGTQRSKGD